MVRFPLIQKTKKPEQKQRQNLSRIKAINLFSSNSCVIKLIHNTGIYVHHFKVTGNAQVRLDFILLKRFPCLNKRRNLLAHWREDGQQWSAVCKRAVRESACRSAFFFLIVMIARTPGLSGIAQVYVLWSIVPFILKMTWIINYMDTLPLTLQFHCPSCFVLSVPWALNPLCYLHSFRLIGWVAMTFDWHLPKTAFPYLKYKPVIYHIS